jgi:hypothetical protein
MSGVGIVPFKLMGHIPHIQLHLTAQELMFLSRDELIMNGRPIVAHLIWMPGIL